MTLRGTVALTKRVPAGHGVSYGLTYRTSAETTLALVPLGYADGIPRAAGSVGEVWLGGRRRRIAGRVAMDQVVVDCGDDAVAAGDEVIVFGPGDRGEPTGERLGRGLRHDRLRDRHPDRSAGAAQVRRPGRIERLRRDGQHFDPAGSGDHR